MKILKYCAVALAAVAIGCAMPASRAEAGALDGFAGAAVGFALGAMVAGQRPAYYGQRSRRVVVYRNRPAARTHYAGARRGGGGVAVSTASDPFAGSGGAKPIPVSGN